ncbi:sensor domain-containing diguanylate cyclase [Alkalimarinus sediminis]|uniref:diguanylate cyclase n=1 Tax=Alkalimarinus sediminis TaxID=1632866 RepID=A0A9E8KQN2_9ALTE|nr:sensor domain-containing diguanylate cyclase [Alkalimarinus sediminis]UZW76628.1 sensor domain-containing diguanylate cyclase [Alkalimarinus sediminis]
MANDNLDIKEFHWLMDMLQTIDVGLVVLDKDFKVQVWNNFMENHSGINPITVKDQVLFDIFEDIPKEWFRQKAESVFLLKNRAFITWELRPYLFKFKNYRPITGTEEFMYQNISISPLASADGNVNHICVIIYDVTDIASNRKALENANKELESLSRTDRLTLLNNRGYWEECLQSEYSRLQRYDTTSSLVMFDIDHFKKVNDTYGHQAGDEVIRVVSKLLRESLRKTDIAGRYGGEEFGIILGHTSADNAFTFCERLRKAVEDTTVVHDNVEIKFTISLGICEASKKLADYKDWLERTDQALYQCKESGRNKTIIYDLSSL